MITHFLDDPTPYTGEQLASHWIYQRTGLMGDAVLGFVGPCEVRQDAMVDLEDVRNDDFIFSTWMLHFIVELFGPSLREGVLLQRLFMSILQDRLNGDLGDYRIARQGDDLFLEGSKKLSVSICTVSPTSVLIHTGINIDATGAPVEAAGLTTDLGMTAIRPWAETCMRRLAEEWQDLQRSCTKVRAVR